MVEIRTHEELQGEIQTTRRDTKIDVDCDLPQLIRDLDLLPQLLGQDWSSVFLQRFDGSVTCVLFREPLWPWTYNYL